MDRMEKGKAAEDIVRKLFTEAGFTVHKYGYEHTTPKLANKNNLIRGKAASYIRHQPDFIVVSRSNEAFFVEVKFRSNFILAKEIFNYPECYVVLLTKYGILAQSTRYIHGKGMDFESLNKMPPFSHVSETLLEKYTKQVKRKLGNETWLGQTFENFFENITKKKFIQPSWFQGPMLIPKKKAVSSPKRHKNKKTIRKSSRHKNRKHKTHRGKGNVKMQKIRAKKRKRRK